MRTEPGGVGDRDGAVRPGAARLHIPATRRGRSWDASCRALEAATSNPRSGRRSGRWSAEPTSTSASGRRHVDESHVAVLVAVVRMGHGLSADVGCPSRARAVELRTSGRWFVGCHSRFPFGAASTVVEDIWMVRSRSAASPGPAQGRGRLLMRQTPVRCL
jgi:hypothetical protein